MKPVSMIIFSVFLICASAGIVQITSRPEPQNLYMKPDAGYAIRDFGLREFYCYENKEALKGRNKWDDMIIEDNTASLSDFLPAHIRDLVLPVDLRDPVNSFYTAIYYHLPGYPPNIMGSKAFGAVINNEFVEISHPTPVQTGDIITIENPSEYPLNNFHHAAVVLNSEYILDKPDTGYSPARIVSVKTLFDEWGSFWDLPEPWPQDGRHKGVLIRFFRKSAKSC